MRQAKGIATAAVAAAITLAASASAQACVSGCSNYIQGQCSQWTTCTPGPSPSVSMPSYGAIAYGRTSRAWGDSYHWGSQAKAESVALKNCEQHGNDCEVMVWFDRRCGAVVSGEGTAAYWGVGRSDRQARAIAQKQCTDDGGKNCEVQVWRCSN